MKMKQMTALFLAMAIMQSSGAAMAQSFGEFENLGALEITLTDAEFEALM